MCYLGKKLGVSAEDVGDVHASIEGDMTRALQADDGGVGHVPL